MKKSSTAENTANKEFDLKQAFVLWNAKSKKGFLYYSGKVADDPEFKLVAFANGNKKNAKEPDIRVYAKTADKSEERTEVASLWVQESPTTGKSYLSGKDNEGKKLVGFFNGKGNPTQPYIRVYYKED